MLASPQAPLTVRTAAVYPSLSNLSIALWAFSALSRKTGESDKSSEYCQFTLDIFAEKGIIIVDLFVKKQTRKHDRRDEITLETLDLKFIDSILEKYGSDKTKIIAIMQDVQERYRYLPQDALEYIAKKVGMSESKLYGVATFYGNFSLDAKGKYVVKVCRGTACHVRKSSNVLQALYDATGTSEHKPNSDDGLFTLEIVSCLGACGLSPVVMVNDTVHAAMTPEKARALVEQLRGEA